MLSDPNVKEITPKVGNRYEAAIALAKRARMIEKRRVETGDRDITDAVDVAGKEIAEEKVFVKKDGKFVVESKNEQTIEELKDDVVDTSDLKDNEE